jgi:hypothetical protein
MMKSLILFLPILLLIEQRVVVAGECESSGAPVVVKVKAFLGQCFIKDHNDPNSNLDETVTDEEAMEANNGSIIQVEREGEMEDEQQQKDEMVEATKPMMTVAQSKSLGISSWNVLK